MIYSYRFLSYIPSFSALAWSFLYTTYDVERVCFWLRSTSTLNTAPPLFINGSHIIYYIYPLSLKLFSSNKLPLSLLFRRSARSLSLVSLSFAPSPYSSFSFQDVLLYDRYAYCWLYDCGSYSIFINCGLTIFFHYAQSINNIYTVKKIKLCVGASSCDFNAGWTFFSQNQRIVQKYACVLLWLK